MAPLWKQSSAAPEDGPRCPRERVADGTSSTSSVNLNLSSRWVTCSTKALCPKANAGDLKTPKI